MQCPVIFDIKTKYFLERFYIESNCTKTFKEDVRNSLCVNIQYIFFTISILTKNTMYFNKSINSDCWENDPKFKEERHLALHTIFRFVTVSYLCSKMFPGFYCVFLKMKTWGVSGITFLGSIGERTTESLYMIIQLLFIKYFTFQFHQFN